MRVASWRSRSHESAAGDVIAGLPLATWLLLVVAVAAGLLVEFVFLRRHRRTPRR